MNIDYNKFLQQKRQTVIDSGITVSKDDINPLLYDFQRDIVVWACRKGKAAIFANTGLGKTFMYIEWSRLIKGTVLIVAPLAVAYQTIREGEKLGVTITYLKNDLNVQPGNIYITNYERIDKFRAELFHGVVLDESSILKSIDGKTRTRLIEMFANVPYRLCATATPAPNDINELGNHAEFLGVMTIQRMSATFFVYDSNGHNGNRPGFRLKGHAHDAFYKWLASWAVAINFPSDLGYDDGQFILPDLNIKHDTIDYEYNIPEQLPGMPPPPLSAIESKRIRRETIESRNQYIANLINNNNEQWLVWCGLNDEAYDLQRRIPGSVNIEGVMSAEDKAKVMLEFQDGKHRVLITKIKIAGMGMNLQNSHNMVFDGIDYSWEGYYQAIRRQWRHGQKHAVNVHIVTTEYESGIYQSVLSKEKEAVDMTQQLILATKKYTQDELKQLRRSTDYKTSEKSGNGWKMLLGDSVERIKELPDDSVDLSVYSPPFGIEVFVYSDSERDLSNANGDNQFWDHYQYIIRENLRIQKPGTVCCVHITDGRILKGQHGYIGIKDFSGDCVEQYIKAGWEYTGRITVWKNPQAQAIRLRMNTLQFTQMRKNSRILRPAMPDYLLLFKKPGDCEIPVTSYERGEIDEETWIQWASPVWYDIKETNVLNASVAKTEQDEKHMCPLQLDFIERCVKLWSNPGEIVFSPFAGIGSEGYEAIKRGREFIGIELKPEYWEVACKNLKNAEVINVSTLFDWAERQVEKETE